MDVLDVGSKEVAAVHEGVLAIYGLDGSLHHALYAEEVERGLFLRDGRLVIFAGETARVIREGHIERTIATGARASLPEELPDGLVFDGGGDRPTWIDVDTGEVASFEVDVGVQTRASGDMITRFGFRAHGGDVVLAPELPAMAECLFVPGDDRAWCAAEQVESCEILGFTLDGRLAGRLPGCAIEAVGHRSVVVNDGGRRAWLSLDGGSAGTLPDRGDHLVLGVGGMSWRDRDVFVDAGKGPVRLEPPPRPTLPSGVVVGVQGRQLLLDRAGKLVDELAGLPGVQAVKSRTSVNTRREVLTVTVDGKVVLELPAKENRSCGEGRGILVTKDPKGALTAWDLLTGAKRWSTKADAAVLTCSVSVDLVLAGVEGGTRVVDGDTGRTITTTSETRRSTDGTLIVGRRDGKATLVDRQGRVYGSYAGDLRPGALVGDTAVAWVQRRGRFDVAGSGPEGLRWERLVSIEPVVQDGIVYVAVEDALIALDPKDGHALWTYTLPGRATSVKGV